MKPVDLVAYLFEGKPHLLTKTLQAWMESSPRFTAFVETYRDKIRKKIRLALEAESALDLRSELELAFSLLNDRRFTVAYEPYASTKIRGPDFAVTYRVNLTFNIEVARIRSDDGSPAGSLGASPLDLARKQERLLRILLDKLGQMQPRMGNLLAIYAQEELVRSIDLEELLHAVKLRVEAKDPLFYAFRSYASPAAFYKDFSRLSGVLLWNCQAQLWVNKQARPALPEKVLKLVSSLACGASRFGSP